MILDMNQFKKKVAGCWLGKNIGGTLGAPFEGYRQLNAVDFYVQELAGNPPPNDDLDLQLVWLNAVEEYGSRVNAHILGEYWLDYIIPHWGEYGAGKTNLRMGLVPPLSGYVNNIYRDSCGCFIRSEIWACIAPGHPEIAVKYAYEDAVADHANEGAYGEIFCAAVESAAFVESDRFKLIGIGLSYIPSDCGVAKGVKTALESYKSGVAWEQARRDVLTAVPGSFGLIWSKEVVDNLPTGERGWDAPGNIGLIIVGWLYGEDDFGKSLCITVNCGEDTDCTAATLGSILGIIHGIDGIPQKWIEPMGEKINTYCINKAESEFNVLIPGTISELTDRILKVTPFFLGSRICDYVNCTNGYNISTLDGEALYCRPVDHNAWLVENAMDSLKESFFTVKYDFPIFRAALDYTEEPFIQENAPKKFILTLDNKTPRQQWLKIKWHLPDGWKALPSPHKHLYLDQNIVRTSKTQVEFSIMAEHLDKDRYDLILEISSDGRHTKGLIPVVLLHI